MAGKMTFDDYRKACGGKGMSYEGYMKNAASGGWASMSKADYEAAEQDYPEISKSEVDADELMKAIDAYETVSDALVEAGGSRESFLHSKMKNGTISKSEQVELGRLWSGDDGSSGEPMRKSLSEYIEEDDNNAQLINASDFLKSMVEGVEGGLNDLSIVIERESGVTRNLLSAQGTLIKSVATVIRGQQIVIDEMGRRLGVVEGQPFVRKSRGADPRDVHPRPQNSGGRGDAGQNQLTKAEVVVGLRRLIKKADKASDSAAMDQIIHATALFENSGEIKPNMIAAVRMELGR